MKKTETFVEIDIKKRENLARTISLFLILATLSIFGVRYILEFLITNRTICSLDSIDTTCGLAKLGAMLLVSVIGVLTYFILFILFFLIIPKYKKIERKK